MALLFLLAPKVNAQDSSPMEEDSVILRYTANEVVIEAFKQNRNLSLQPVSASLISEATIRENNLSNIKEVSAFVPNLFIPDYGSKMTSPVYIRGIGAAKNAPSVGLYVDGVPYFDRSTFDFNIHDVERIEVLRGPQGTIYGRNTMGGIMNVYTKSPFNYKGTNVNLSAGNYNTYQSGVSLYGASDNQKIGYSLSGNYMHSGGYFQNKYTGKRADPIDALSTRARLSWRILPRLTANLIFAYEYSDQDGYPYRVYDKATETAKDIEYNAHSFYRRNMSGNGLNIEYVTDNFKLGSQTSFQFYDGKQGLDQDFSPESIYYVDFFQRQQMYSQEFNIKSIKEDAKYQWQFGVFGFHQNYAQSNDVNYNKLAKDSVQDVHNPTGGFAIYHQSTFRNIADPGLSLVLGIRYDFEKTRNALGRTTLIKDKDPIVYPVVKDRTSFSQLIPKASLQYTFGYDGSGYFSVSRGYKTGGFNTTADDDKDRTFEPEYSWCYDLGVKSSLFNKLLSFDLAFFYIDWKNQQISQTKPSGQGFLLRNAGKSASKGLEFSTQLNPLKNLNFQFSYGYTNAKFKDYKVNAKTDYSHNYLPMVPRNTVSFGAGYRINTGLSWLDNISLHGQYTGTGKLYWNDNNDVSQPYYGVFNGKVSFVKNSISVDLWAKNIGGKDYIVYYFTAMGHEFVQKGRPFTCGVNMNLKF
ncbi:MAG: TonB-dependent receptor [Prevotella sp.]|nr:TonB-dependent receptor [Prevotella sp.]